MLLDAEKVIRVWQVDSHPIGDLTPAVIQQKADDLRALDTEVDQLRAALANKLDQLAEGTKELKAMVARGRGNVGAIYGRDSRQYEEAGGKPPRRRRK
ncbi:MAG: hypothetical protein QOJ64_1930 [Acidobacteriota bacterium]|nr:hypothetical protein [Acidobacteriota bacterium]